MSDFMFLSGFAAGYAQLHNLQNFYQTILIPKKKQRLQSLRTGVHIFLYLTIKLRLDLNIITDTHLYFRLEQMARYPHFYMFLIKV